MRIRFLKGSAFWLLISVLLPVIVPIFWDGSGINCFTEEIDIRSGQIRSTRYVYWVPLYRRVEPSLISEVLGLSASPDSAEWHLVNTLSLGIGHSPHHAYHNAIAQITLLEVQWDLAPFTPAAKRETASRVLAAWQEGKGHRPASSYLNSLAKLAHDRFGEHPPKPIDIPDLPH